jgi:hypothetical protein
MEKAALDIVDTPVVVVKRDYKLYKTLLMRCMIAWKAGEVITEDLSIPGIPIDVWNPVEDLVKFPSTLR